MLSTHTGNYFLAAKENTTSYSEEAFPTKKKITNQTQFQERKKNQINSMSKQAQPKLTMKIASTDLPCDKHVLRATAW